MDHPIYTAQMVYARHSFIMIIDGEREGEGEEEKIVCISKKIANIIVIKGAPNGTIAPNTHSLFDSKHTPCSSTHITNHQC